MQRAGAWTAVWTPITLAQCAALARERGMEVALNDCIVEEKGYRHVQDIVRAFKPGLVVVNLVTPSFESDLSAARIIKEVDPDIHVTIVGIHGTALPEYCLEKSSHLDSVIRGEPELTALELAQVLDSTKDLGEVKGLTFRRGKEVKSNPDRPFIEDLDVLPFPAWDLIDRARYTMPFTGRQFLLVGTARGCSFPCTFCADHTYYGKRLRIRKPVRIVDELEHNQKTFQISDFLFWSESFTLNRKFCMSVAEEILKRKIKICWVCNSRVDHVDREMLKIFRKAGCTMIGYGVEGGVQQVLDRMRKGITLDQTREAVRLAKEEGIEVVAHCVIGFPGETEETIEETIRFVKNLDLDFAQFYCAVPFPGSDLYKEAREKGWINAEDWTLFEQNFSVMDFPELKADTIMALRRKAYRSFYLRPKIIFRTLKRLRSLREIKQFASMVKDFLTWV